MDKPNDISSSVLIMSELFEAVSDSSKKHSSTSWARTSVPFAGLINGCWEESTYVVDFRYL